MDNDLIQQLRDAGHTEQADQLRDRGLARQLREAGRDDLAAQLEGEGSPPSEPTSLTTRQHEADRVVAALKRAGAWPGGAVFGAPGRNCARQVLTDLEATREAGKSSRERSSGWRQRPSA
jgi:hypothetical protein